MTYAIACHKSLRDMTRVDRLGVSFHRLPKKMLNKFALFGISRVSKKVLYDRTFTFFHYRTTN